MACSKLRQLKREARKLAGSNIAGCDDIAQPGRNCEDTGLRDRDNESMVRVRRLRAMVADYGCGLGTPSQTSLPFRVLPVILIFL
jgi:hypothetical protein